VGEDHDAVCGERGQRVVDGLCRIGFSHLALGRDAFALDFIVDGTLGVQFSLPALAPLPEAIPAPEVSQALDIGLTFSRTSTAAPLTLGPTDGTHFSIGELSGSIHLKSTAPRVEFNLKDSKLVLRVGDDALLGAVIGDAIEVALTFGLIADAAGLRLTETDLAALADLATP